MAGSELLLFELAGASVATSWTLIYARAGGYAGSSAGPGQGAGACTCTGQGAGAAAALAPPLPVPCPAGVYLGALRAAVGRELADRQALGGCRE